MKYPIRYTFNKPIEIPLPDSGFYGRPNSVCIKD